MDKFLTKMKKKRNVDIQYETDYNGQKVVVTRFKPKERKVKSNARHIISNCPCCGSHLVLNEVKVWSCDGSKLKYWESEFIKLTSMNDIEKGEYLSNISSDSQFFDLYDRWKYAQEENKPEEFNCGYTNNIFLPVGSTRTIIPDPLYVKWLEIRLKRKLTEEELMNEGELYIRYKKVTDRWFKGSRKVIIPYIILPDEEEI